MYIGLKEITTTEINVGVIEKVYDMTEEELLNQWKESLELEMLQ